MDLDESNRTGLCLNNSNPLEMHYIAVQTVVYSILLAFSVLGNLLVIIVVSKTTEIKATVNYFIFNMAVSDLLFTMIAVPRTIGELLSKISKTWYLTGLLGNITCKLCYFTQDVCTAVSILTLVAIAVDRYYAVVYPMRTGVITSTFRKILVTCIWLIAMVFHVPYFLAFRLQTDPVSKVTICIYHWKYNVSSGKAYFALSSGFLFILPLLVMSAIYTIILISIRSRKIPGNANSSSLRRHKIKRNRKVLTMVLAVLFAFLVCWLPMNIYGYLLFFQWYMPTPCTQPLEQLVILCIAYSNAAVNPFIYFALSENYRHAALHLMRCRKRRPSRHLENTITTRNSSFATQLMPKNSKRALKDNTELTELSKRYKSRPDSARCCLVEKSLNSTCKIARDYDGLKKSRENTDL